MFWYFSDGFKCKAIKGLLLFLFILGGQFAVAQSDSTDQLKLDVGITRNKNRHLWPIIYRENNEESKDLQLAFTLYQHKEVFDSNYVHSHLLPLYYRNQLPGHTLLKIGTVVYPSLFEYASDSFQNRKSYRLLPLLPDIDLMNITRSSNGMYVENNALFFVYFKNDVQSRKMHLVVFPLYWYYKNGLKTSHTFLPVFRVKTDEEKDSLRHYKSVHHSFYPLLTFTESVHSHKIYWVNYERSYEMKKQTVLLFHNKSERSYVWLDSKQNLWATSKQTGLYPLINYEYKWSSTEGKELRKFSLFPIYYHIDNWLFKYKKTYAGLLYYNSERKAEQTNWFFPLWYKYHQVNQNYSDENTLAITPLYWHYRVKYTQNGAETDNKVLFPLYWNFKENFGISNNWLMLFPLYYQSNLEDNKYKIRSLAMLMWWGKHPSYSFKFLVPLYYNSQYTFGDTYTMATPLIWRIKSKEKKSLSIVPLYFGTTYANGNYSHLLFPLFYKTRTKFDTTLAIFPLYWHANYKNNQWTKIVLPFYYNVKNSESWTRFVLPFYFDQRNYLFKERITGIVPLYWVRKSDNGEVNRVLFPILFTSKFGSRSSLTVFPLYWQFKDKNSSTRMLLPLYFYDRNVSDTNLVVFPLVWSLKNKNSKTLVLPFYSWNNNYYEKSITKSFGYLYWVQHKPEITKHMLFPLFYQRKANSGDSVYKWSSIDYFITPLIHKSVSYYPIRTVRWFNIYPVFYHYSEKYDKKDESRSNKTQYYNVLFPIYFRHKTEDKTEKSLVIFPIYWHYHNVDNYDNRFKRNSTVILPVFYHKLLSYEHKFRKRDFYAFLYYRHLENDSYNMLTKRHIRFFTPLLGIYQREYYTKVKSNYSFDSSNLTVSALPFLPLYYQSVWKYPKEQSDKTVGISLFIWYKKNQNRVKFDLWPLVRYEKFANFDMKFHIAPLFWVKKSEFHSYNVLFPLYSVVTKGKVTRMSFLWQVYKYKAIEGQMSGHRLLIKAFQTDKYVNGDYETRLFHKLYVNMKKDSATEKTLFPFYGIQHSKNGSYSKRYCFGLFSRTKTKIPHTQEFYMEERLLWFIRWRSNIGYLRAKGIHYKKGI